MTAVLIFVIVPSNSFFGLSSVVLLSSVALLASALAFNISSSEERPAEFYLYLYFLLFYLLPGYIHLSTQRFPFYNRNYRDGDVLTAAICVFCFSLAFVSAYTFSFAHQKAPLRYVSHRRSAQYNLASVYIAFALVLAFAFGLDNYTIWRGETTLLKVEYTPATLIALNVPRILSFVAFLVSLVGLTQRLSAARAAFGSVSFAAFLTLNFPMAIPRFLLFAYLIIGLLVFIKQTRFRKGLIATAFFIGQLTIFPAISLLSRGDIQELLSTSFFEYFAKNGDFDGFQSTINVVEFVEGAGLHYGANLLSAALFFIPRSWWPEKSYGTGGEAASFTGYSFINISAPLPSEFYVDFGLLGTIIGAALLGLFLARLDRRIKWARATDDKWELFLPATVVGYLFIILRGSLVGVLGPCVLTCCIVWLSMRLTRSRIQLNRDRHLKKTPLFRTEMTDLKRQLSESNRT